MTYEVGVQSYCYRTFDVDEMIAELAQTPVTAVELTHTHIQPDDGLAEARRVRDRLADHGIDVCGWGSDDFRGETGPTVEEIFELGETLGVEYLTTDVGPEDDETIDAMIEQATAHGFELGVHNHGPDPWGVYESLADVQAVLEGRPSIFGACVDTGHYLRVDEPPHEVIPALGQRVHCVHVTDFENGEEFLPGDGALDLAELLELLDTHTEMDAPLIIEYEADASNPTPAIDETADRLAALME